VLLLGCAFGLRASLADDAKPAKSGYSWLHFGPKAKVRVLIRLAGKAVTFEHYAADKPTGRKEQFAGRAKFRDIPIKDPDGKTSYVITGLNVSVVQEEKRTFLAADVDIKGPVAYRQYCYAEIAADRDKAPIAHFHGPLRIQAEMINWELPRDLTLRRGGIATHIRALVGTIDRKKGCWVVVRSGVDAGKAGKFPDFPKGMHPVVGVEFPPKRPGGQPVKRRYELDDFC
jgi:hypothetical protein